MTAISRALAELALERGARSVSLLHSGSWPSGAFDKNEIRARLGLRADAFYSGFMGRTTAELPWCYDALARSLGRYPKLRLAMCGMPASELNGISSTLRGRIDYLGQLTPAAARDFAACLDLALLPMEENTFNLSRLPQKFGDYVASGVPLLCSTVGECGLLIPRFPWVFPAGTTRAEWAGAFDVALDRVSRGDVPAFDPHLFREHLSWEGLSYALAQTYHTALAGRPATSVPNNPLTVSLVPLHATD